MAHPEYSTHPQPWWYSQLLAFAPLLLYPFPTAARGPHPQKVLSERVQRKQKVPLPKQPRPEGMTDSERGLASPANGYRNLSCEVGIMGTLTPQAGYKTPEVPRECSVSQEEPPCLVTHSRGEDSVGEWGWMTGLETRLISRSPSKTLRSDNHQPLSRESFLHCVWVSA